MKGRKVKRNEVKDYENDEREISSPTEVAIQIGENVSEPDYYKHMGSGFVPELHVYEFENKTLRFLGFWQNYPMTKKEFENFIYNYSDTTADRDSFNGFGQGARATAFAKTADRAVHVFINNKKNGLWFGKIERKKGEPAFGYSNIGREINLNEMPSEFAKFFATMPMDSTLFGLVFRKNSQTTKQKFLEKIMDIQERQILKGKMKLFDENTELTPDVYPIESFNKTELMGKLEELRDAELKELGKSDMRSIDSLPDIDVYKTKGKKNYVQFFSHNIKVTDPRRSQIRSPIFVEVNWNFLLNYMGRTKRAFGEILEKIEKILAEELKKFFAEETSIIDEELTKNLQKIVDIVCENELPTTEGIITPTQKKYRFVCNDCSEFSYFELAMPPTLHYPTEEEMKKICCDKNQDTETVKHCGSLNVRYFPIDPDQDTESLTKCPKCGTKLETKVLVESDTELQNKQLNLKVGDSKIFCPQCGWFKYHRVKKKGGQLKIEVREKSSKWLALELRQSLIGIGKISDLLTKIGSNKKLFDSLITEIATDAVYYIKLQMKEDVSDRVLKSLEENYKRKEKHLLTVLS